MNKKSLFRGVTCAFTSTTLLGAFSLALSSQEAAGEVPQGNYAGRPADQASALSELQLSPSDPNALLERVRQSAKAAYSDLKNFVCREEITRFRGNARKPQGQQVDVITSVVSYDRSGEHYSEIYQNNKPLPQIRGLSGAWSEGEYGTLLGETIKALQSKPVRFSSYAVLDGKTAAVYTFDYSPEDSPWEIQILGNHYSIPFRGQVWASPETGDILQIDRIAEEAPLRTGISGVNWSVSFGVRQMEGRSFRLPLKGIYSVSYNESGRHEWNVMAFSEYKRYGSEVVVHFE
jgi:hypothetical protein